MQLGSPWLNQLVEIGYQESNNVSKLSFLHLLNGNLSGLEEVKNQAKKTGDLTAQFNISLYQGDIRSRIKLLIDMGQIALAYQSAVNHGLDDLASAIKKVLPEEVKYKKPSVAFVPPKPLVQNYELSSESRIS